ncbi:MAG: PQQ-binding-like beta-propeller repeat protein [Opitutaceae bacterium]|nr:PQQ-binding-like beta-propeller repeat protein [Opitutaceae bacterium]
MHPQALFSRGGWFALLTVALFASRADAQEWTRFRGPNGTGHSPAKGVPTTWTESDFRWRVPIAGASHSQPVIWGDKLFLMTALDGGKERALLCLDKRDGKELWRQSYVLPTHRPGSKNSGYANTSAVVDAQRVVAVFVSEQHQWVRAYDHAGKELWARDLGPFKSQHGHGASPMIFEHTVIVPNDQDSESFVVALHLKTGAEVWKSARSPGRGTNIAAAYCTPVTHRRADGSVELIFTSQSHGVSSLDARTGALNWESPVFDKRMVASPIVAGDLAIGSCGSGAGTGNYLSAIKLGGSGNVAKTHVAYTLRRATPYVPTPLYHDGRLYLISDGGIASAIEAATGKEIWSERLPRAEFFASPVLIDGKLYVASTAGDMFVLATGDTFNVIARNPLGEGTHSTACVDGGRIYVKTFTHLVCIGGK